MRLVVRLHIQKVLAVLLVILGVTVLIIVTMVITRQLALARLAVQIIKVGSAGLDNTVVEMDVVTLVQVVIMVGEVVEIAVLQAAVADVDRPGMDAGELARARSVKLVPLNADR